MISPELEEVMLNVPVKPDDAEMKGNVEKWMKDLEIKMKQTIKVITNKARADFSAKSFLDWIKSWPAMAIIANDQYNWTMSTETALKLMKKDKSSMKNFFEVSKQGILEIVEIVKGKLSSDDRRKIGAMITLKVHCKEIIGSMVDHHIQDTTEFEWKSQLRY